MRESLVAGLWLGLLFGAANLIVTWLAPLSDDTPGVLLQFYGPMFLAWTIVSYRAARRRGRVLAGVGAGLAVACVTFCVFELVVLLRVNVFLDQLTARADWQNMMARFRESGSDNLRTFVNLDYIKGLPFKTAVASVIGGVMGLIGGSLSRIRGAAPSASAH